MMRSKSSPPAHNSMMRYTLRWSSKVSKILTMLGWSNFCMILTSFQMTLTFLTMGFGHVFMARNSLVDLLVTFVTEPNAPDPSFFFSTSYRSVILIFTSSAFSSRPAALTLSTQADGPPASIWTRYFFSRPSPVILRTVPHLPFCAPDSTSTFVPSGKESGSPAALLGGGAPLPAPLPVGAEACPKATMRGDTIGSFETTEVWLEAAASTPLTDVVHVDWLESS